MVEWLALRQTDSRPMVATLNWISRREWMYGLEDGGRYNKTERLVIELKMLRFSFGVTSGDISG